VHWVAVELLEEEGVELVKLEVVLPEEVALVGGLHTEHGLYPY